MLTIKQAAQRIGKSEITIRRHLPYLNARKRSGKWYISPETLDSHFRITTFDQKAPEPDIIQILKVQLDVKDRQINDLISQLNRITAALEDAQRINAAMLYIEGKKEDQPAPDHQEEDIHDEDSPAPDPEIRMSEMDWIRAANQYKKHN